MSITVEDLFQYNPSFDLTKIKYLTGKTDFQEKDTVDLTRLAALNDKNLSIFAAQKEGKSFVNSIKDDNMRTQIAQAVKINADNEDNGKTIIFRL